MSDNITLAGNLIQIISQSRENALRKVNEELINMYWKMKSEIYEWCLRHRWHPASSGGIIADVYFQAVDDKVEISWNNRDMEEYITYKYDFGGDSVDKHVFYEVVDSFLKEYAKHWF